MLARLGVYPSKYALNITMQEYSGKEKYGIFLVNGGERYFCKKNLAEPYLDQKDFLGG